MNPTVVSLIVLVFLASVVGAVGMVLRDIWVARRVVQSPPRPRLQRLPPSEPARGTSGPVASFDRGFIDLLRDAGLTWDPTSAVFVFLLLGTICGAILFFFDERIEPAVVAGLVGAILPALYLLFLRARRQTLLQDQLPAALETLARSIRAGRTLDQAIGLLGEHSPEPLAREFRWCAKQLDLGLGLPVVVRSLVRRVRLYDVRILAATLAVHRQTGGNVVTVLERLAQVVRERINFRRQLRATTAAGRLSAGMVAMVAPGVFLYFFFFRQDYVGTMLQSPLGQSLLAVIVLLEVVGLVWTARLLRPSY
jgi:tight adherence protein B